MRHPILRVIFLCSILISLSACPFCGGEDIPFKYPEIEKAEGGESPDPCADVTCEEGEVCNPSTGVGVCEAEADDGSCESDEDCDDGYFCSQSSNTCVEELDQVCPDVECAEGEVPLPPECECAETFKLYFHATARILMDGKTDTSPDYVPHDIPNRCDGEAWRNPAGDEFQCPVDLDAYAARDDADDGLPRAMPLGSELYERYIEPYMLDDYRRADGSPILDNGFDDRVSWGEYVLAQFERTCNMMDEASGSRQKCLNRNCPPGPGALWTNNIACNVPMTPYPSLYNEPIILHLTPPDSEGRGVVVITKDDFPRYPIIGTSPELISYLMIDGGRGLSIDGSPRDVPMERFYGEYWINNKDTVTEADDEVHFNLGYRFRIQAMNTIAGQLVPQPNNPNIQVEVTDDEIMNTLLFFSIRPPGPGPSAPGATNMTESTDVVPADVLPPALLTTEEAVANPGESNCAGVRVENTGPITGNGIPLHIADRDWAKMRLAVGVRIYGIDPECPARNNILGQALSNTALFVEFDGYVLNDDEERTNFRGMSYASQFAGVGGRTSVRVYHQATGESEREDVIGQGAERNPDTGMLEGTAAFGQRPFYYISDILTGSRRMIDPYAGFQTAGRFQAVENITIENRTPATEVDIGYQIIPSDGAFSIAASVPESLAPYGEAGSEVTIGVTFAPGEEVPDCDLVAGEGGEVFKCEADIIFGDAAKVHFIGYGRSLSGMIEVKEIEWRSDQPHYLEAVKDLFPDLGNPISNRGKDIDFGEVLHGTSGAKLIQIRNIGVESLNLTGYSLPTIGSANYFAVSCFLRRRADGMYACLGGDYSLPAYSLAPTALNEDRCSTGEDQCLYLFLLYTPFTPVKSTPEDGDLVISSSSGGVTVTMKGIVDMPEGDIVRVYVEDPECTSRGTACRPDLVGPEGENLLMAREYWQGDEFDAVASFRSSGTLRAVYVAHGMPVGGSFTINSLPADFDEGEFTFVQDASALSVEIENCPARDVANFDYRCAATCDDGSWCKKIGTITFKPDEPDGDAGAYMIKSREFPIDLSIGTTDRIFNLKLVGARNAPASDNMTLHVKRMFAGMDPPIMLPNTRNALTTTVTPGMIYGKFGYLSDANSGLVDRFRISVDLNSASGLVAIHPVFTPPDIDRNTGNDGVTIFNIPGSGQLGSAGMNPYIYAFDCLDAARTNADIVCSYLYIYLAGYNHDGTGAVGSEAGAPIYSGYSGDGTIYALDPRGMDAQGFYGTEDDFETAKARGYYDPATGEMTIPSLAVRLYTPFTNASSADGARLLAVDTTLTGGLTTGCVDESIMGDGVSADFLNLLRNPSDTDAPANIDTEDANRGMREPSYGPNPIPPYVTDESIAGRPTFGCRHGYYHGRPIFAAGAGLPVESEDYTGTLDNNPGPAGRGSTNLTNPNFDISGVMKTTGSVSQVSGASAPTMYITIKACISGGDQFPEEGCTNRANGL